GFGAWTLSWASISSHVKREVPVATGEIDPAFAGAARGLGSSFLRGWRSMPGSIPATSQLDWLAEALALFAEPKSGLPLDVIDFLAQHFQTQPLLLGRLQLVPRDGERLYHSANPSRIARI